MLFGKGSRVAGQVDSEAKAGKSYVKSILTATEQLDFYENQLGEIASELQKHDPSAAAQFNAMRLQINNTQKQIQSFAKDAYDAFEHIDKITDQIQ